MKRTAIHVLALAMDAGAQQRGRKRGTEWLWQPLGYIA